MKTIDIQAKQWRDKKYGNSYFSAQITIDYQLKTEKTYYLPMQYGHNGQHEHEAKTLLQKEGLLPDKRFLPLHSYCPDNGIILRSSIETDCKKKEVESFGKDA